MILKFYPFVFQKFNRVQVLFLIFGQFLAHILQIKRATIRLTLFHSPNKELYDDRE